MNFPPEARRASTSGTQGGRDDSKTEGLCQFESFPTSTIAPLSIWAA